MQTRKNKKSLFFVYAMKSLRNGLWYIGLTGNLAQRRREHLRLRPDLYRDGHIWKVLGQRRSLEAIGKLEAFLIRKYGTVWPGGNNLRAGGLTGHLLAFVRKHGTDADTALLASGSVYSAKTLEKMKASQIAWHRKNPGVRKGIPKSAAHVKAMKDRMRGRPSSFIGKKHRPESIAKMSAAKKGKGLGVSKKPHSQEVRDKIAAAKIVARISTGKPLSYGGIWAQRKRAWQRFRLGLKSLPGTEHYLLQPEVLGRIAISPETRQRMSEAQKRAAPERNAARRASGRALGRPKGFLLSQKSKDKIALRRMHHFEKSGKAISYGGAWNRRKRFWQRHDKGLPPLPGTEHFLKEPRRPPPKAMGEDSHRRRSETMKKKFARWREEGRPMPRPPGSTGPQTQERKDRLASLKVRKGLTNGLQYNYKQILKCVAKAKKRQAAGLRPIPGTECFVRLQTAPTQGPRYTFAQRAEYQRIMIERVNAWLRLYAIDRGWRDS